MGRNKLNNSYIVKSQFLFYEGTKRPTSRAIHKLVFNTHFILYQNNNIWPNGKMITTSSNLQVFGLTNFFQCASTTTILSFIHRQVGVNLRFYSCVFDRSR